MNLACNLERSALYFGDSLAIVEGENTYTYAELNRLAGLAGAGLASLGLGPGDRLGLCAPNSTTWLAMYFGALKIGMSVVTLSAMLTPHEFPRLLAHSKPRALFINVERLDEAQAARAESGTKHIICPGGDLDFEALLARADEPAAAVDCERDQVACILYTGGTTGLPKGVLLSHENVHTAVANVVHQERSSHTDRLLCFLPFNHVFGQMHIMNSAVLAGAGVVLLPGFDLDAVLEAIEKHGVTNLYAVPTIYVRLLQVPGLREKLKGVRYCFSAAASMAREVVRQWKETTGLDIHESFGMTETASMVTYNHYNRHVVGSVGEAVGTNEVCIKDPQGQKMPRGVEGEICVRARNVMLGYLDNPEATAQTLKDGWLHTGDIGYLDDIGNLFIVDRLKDLIITGGENVYPREVEEALYLAPEVAECSVVGLPDAEYGERVTAVCVPAPGMEIVPEKLKAFLKQHLSGFKVPKEYIITDALPKSPAGKVLKREIRKELLGAED